ncbi:type IV secretory system conjugative DNA transfer family protein [Aliiroseovarius sp. CAU 1755]
MDWSWEVWTGVGIAIFVVLMLLAWRFEEEQKTTYGSAMWCRVWDVFRSRLFRRGGLYVGDWIGRLGVYYKGAHAITFGVTGSGKGTSAILPNLLHKRFLFVVDPGGENTAIASKAWRKAGMEMRCINPFAMFTGKPWNLPTDGFNPLDLLDPASPAFAADAQLFAEMLTPRAGKEDGNTSYFKDAATSAKRAMIVHIKTAEPEARQNIGTLYEYAYADTDGWEALLAAMKANPACGQLAAREANKLERIEAQAQEEFSAVMSTIQQDLAFLADELVRDTLSRSDVSFDLLKGRKNKKGGAISVVMPLEYIESHAAITRLAMACAILELQRMPYAKSRVTFLIDEAAALGKIIRLPNWLATLRKYNVGIWTIWQNIGQVADLYGANWQTLVSNCGLMQILGVGDLQTAQYTQALMGQCTVATASTNARGERTVSQTARPLLMAEELMRTSGRYQIVLLGRLWPMELKKTPYWKQPSLRGRFHPNPYREGPTREPGSLDEWAANWGSIYYMLVWWMAPHPLAACIMAAPIVLWLMKLFGVGAS